MIFTYDTDVTLSHAAALANTGPASGSQTARSSPTSASLLAWMDRWEWTGRRPTEAEVEAVRVLRPRLRAVWALRRTGSAEAANALLEEGRGPPPARAAPALRLARPRHHSTTPRSTAGSRWRWGWPLVDVVRLGETDRLKVCAGEDCGGPHRRPQPQPVSQVLRRHLRHPGQRRGLPGPPGRHQPRPRGHPGAAPCSRLTATGAPGGALDSRSPRGSGAAGERGSSPSRPRRPP